MSKRDKGIKSPQRVRDYGEVFTAEREVKAMLDMIPEDACQIDSTYYEPCCGTGNFTAEILRRKLEKCKGVKDGLVALASIYSIEIQEDNVQETRERLYNMFRERFGDHLLAGVIVCHNIVHGDALTGRHLDGTPIDFMEEAGFYEIQESKKQKERARRQHEVRAGNKNPR